MLAEADLEEEVRSVRAEISYLLPGPDINRRFVSAGVEVNTGSYGPFEVTVRDARAIKHHFTLDRQGFTLSDRPTAIRDFYDKDEVDRLYMDEVADHVRALTGASFVAPMGWMIRNSGDIAGYQKKQEGPYTHHGGVQPPAGEAHIDTEPSRADRQARAVYDKFRPGGPGYGRFIYSSFWRTFSPPPQDCPLALCDHRSVGDDEGVPNVLHVVDEIPTGDAMFAEMGDADLPAAAIFRYNPDHRWWYFSNMTRDEAILLKFHDSDHSVAWRVPHTAFWDTSFPDRQVRASIECRSVAYFE
ncbi:MAG: hypothetical protein H7X93_08620 [Sphingomonadaceae bacterium]|nr:hypothetical protein [Sphingomonadaceae bacterium]